MRGHKSMDAQEKSVWQTIAALRWPGCDISGNGRFAVTDIEDGKVTLFEWRMGAEAFRRERVGTRSVYLMDHVPAPQHIKTPGRWEN